MLDTFEIISASGVVLWSRTYAPVRSSIINNFIADVFIEEKGFDPNAKDVSTSTNTPYKSGPHTLKWTIVKELGVIFVVGIPPRRFLPRLVSPREANQTRRLCTGHYYISHGSTSSWIISRPSLLTYTATN